MIDKCGHICLYHLGKVNIKDSICDYYRCEFFSCPFNFLKKVKDDHVKKGVCLDIGKHTED